LEKLVARNLVARRVQLLVHRHQRNDAPDDENPHEPGGHRKLKIARRLFLSVAAFFDLFFVSHDFLNLVVQINTLFPLSQSVNSVILPAMRFGPLTLKSNLFLSPLAGYTNLPFRLVVREVGGVDLCTTDLVNARSLLEKNPKAFKLIETSPADSPLAVQLFGSVPEEMRDAAIYLESIGVASIDINMGCPVKKVVKVGGGSAMMTELDKTAALVKGMVDAVKIPVTAKMRLGWDDDNLTAPDLAHTLEDVGIAAIFVHGRTREQGFGGAVNLAGIRKVVEAVKTIPVIGNGDIVTPQAAKKMFDETGCAGVSIGRGAFYDPWIFKRTLQFVASGELPPEPTFTERIRIMRRHLDLMIEVFGEELGCRMFRKVAPWYAKRFGPCHEFNKQVVQVSTKAQFDKILENYIRWRQQFVDEHGELLPRFRQPPMVASFMREAELASTQREHIPVPRGPVEVW
jgi:nifR3 family TIM-barrel protein